ncbi:MAG: SDR family oxidoreductase [Myxococcales bacterium]|nr:SDR family oxidoreductase [Myxococcales bacterium]
MSATDWKLEGKVALITGASRGIGRAIAERLAREGVKLALAAKTVEPDPRLPGTLHDVAAAVKAAGSEALVVQMDVRDDAAVAAGVAATVERFGRLDIAIHNAGALWWKPIEHTAADRFDLVMGVNARGAHLLAHHAIRHLRAAGGGHFLVMSPPILLASLVGKSAYMLSKLGMTMTAMALADEGRRDGIAANALWPETLVESAATVNYRIGNPSLWYKADLVADAAYEVLRTPPRERTGQALLCMRVLQEAGVTDLTPYRCDPNSEPPVLDPSFALPQVGGKDKSDGTL